MPSSSSSSLQWLSLVGIIWLQAVSGTNTNFPAYSSQLKDILSMSQVQLNNLAFASDAGKLFGWVSGIAALYLPLWLVLIIGSTLGLFGYGLQYLLVTNHISFLSYWHVFLLTVLAGNSICWINTVCYVVTIRNFRYNRQAAVGLTTSYQGLGAKIYTNIVEAVSPNKKAQAFLLLNSLLPLITCLLTSPLVRAIEPGRPKHMGVGFITIYIITIVTGIYAVMSSLEFFTSEISALSNLLGIVVSLIIPLAVPMSEKMKEMVGDVNKESSTRVYDFALEEINDISLGGESSTGRDHNIEVMGEREENGREEVKEIGVKEEVGVKLMMKKVDFWLYFFVYFFGATIGLVYLNNLGQIAESRGSSSTSSLVSLSSSFGFFGRLMPSLLDYFLRREYTLSRPASIMALMAPLGGSMFLLLSKTDLALYTSTAIIGVCTGAITSLAVSITNELFGTKNFSVNHNVVVANIPIGSFLFGYLAALLYRKEGNQTGKCIGMDCYGKTFVVWGSLCSLGTFLALVLYFRTRKFYTQIRQ